MSRLVPPSDVELSWSDFVRQLEADPWPRWRTYLPQVQKRRKWDPTICYSFYEGSVYQLKEQKTHPFVELGRWAWHPDRHGRLDYSWRFEQIATAVDSVAWLRRQAKGALDELIMELAL